MKNLNRHLQGGTDGLRKKQGSVKERLKVDGEDNRFTFTRAKLEGLRSPTSGRMYYYDDVVRSLVLVVTPNGSKSFQVYRKVNRRPVRRTLGTFDPTARETREWPEGTKPLDRFGRSASLSVTEARKIAVAVNASLDAGVDPAAERRNSKNALTLGELFTHYRRYLIDDKKARTVSERTWMFERYLGELPDVPRKKHGQERTKPPGSVNWQRRPISAITPADVSRIRLSLAENVGGTTANRVVELLNAIFNYAKRKARPPLFVGENPAADADKCDEHERERFVQSHEAARFIEALDSETDSDFRDYVMLSICAGSRRKNLLRMRWDELSLDGGTWTLTGEKMKNGQPLTIPLVPDAVEILRRRAANSEGDEVPSEWVFPGGTTAGHIGPPRKKWAQFLKRAKLTDLHLHDLRRTLGSWMTNTGANLQTTMRALGHKSIQSAMVYQRLEINPVREAMQRGIAGFFEAAKVDAAKVVEMPHGTRKPSTRSGGR